MLRFAAWSRVLGLAHCRGSSSLLTGGVRCELELW